MRLRRFALSPLVALLVMDTLAAGCDDGATVSGDTDDVLLADSAPSPNDATTTADAAAPGQGSLPPVPPDGPVSPACLDGRYREALPDDRADIGARVASYVASDHRAFVAEVLAARFPLGAWLVSEGLTRGAALGHCLDLFVGDTSSAASVLSRLSTVVHECGHFLDIATSGFNASNYVITESLTLTCPRVGNGLARSRLNEDAYADLLPDDFYRQVYLDGDPDDATFDGGDQGYDMVLEETLQYVNSLATDWALRDQLRSGQSISARDGLLTFFWYLTRYLRLARTEYPSEYAKIRDNACWREATLTVWGRGWQYLTLTEALPALGIRDEVLLDLVMAPELLAEIEALRDAAGCP